MREPSNSLDPVDWLVWGDFLSDLGKEEEGERARCIGRGLGKYPEGLYLVYPRGKRFLLSGVCFFKEGDDPSPMDAANPYCFSGVIPFGEKNRYGLDSHRISPPHQPRIFAFRPTLVTLFWDKLAELGRITQTKEDS